MGKMNQRREVGQQGETLAAEYLHERGYTIVTRNWRCAAGELDIVAERANRLIFVEVRTRRGERFGTAAESITATKRARLVALAESYLQAHAVSEQAWQIDVITVTWQGQSMTINHLENAVGW